MWRLEQRVHQRSILKKALRWHFLERPMWPRWLKRSTWRTQQIGNHILKLKKRFWNNYAFEFVVVVIRSGVFVCYLLSTETSCYRRPRREAQIRVSQLHHFWRKGQSLSDTVVNKQSVKQCKKRVRGHVKLHAMKWFHKFKAFCFQPATFFDFFVLHLIMNTWWFKKGLNLILIIIVE